MRCKNHKNIVAIEKCDICNQWFCDDCVTEIDTKLVCDFCNLVNNENYVKPKQPNKTKEENKIKQQNTTKEVEQPKIIVPPTEVKVIKEQPKNYTLEEKKLLIKKEKMAIKQSKKQRDNILGGYIGSAVLLTMPPPISIIGIILLVDTIFKNINYIKQKNNN